MATLLCAEHNETCRVTEAFVKRGNPYPTEKIDKLHSGLRESIRKYSVNDEEFGEVVGKMVDIGFVE